MSRALEELLEVLSARGQQYGQPDDDKANLRGASKVGVDPIVGAYIRSNDKHIRVQNLLMAAGGPGPLRITPQIRAQLWDNLLDIAGYSIKEMELLDEREDESLDGGDVPALHAGCCCLRAGCPSCDPDAKKGRNVPPVTGD